jgi:hypothetical protein
VFNPAPRIEAVEIAPGHQALVIDAALSEPERWVALAQQHRGEFEGSPHNAYPGPELRLPDALTARREADVAQHARARLGARRTIRSYSRLALATRAPAQLEPRQWICHRDRLDTDPTRCVLASVLYLFREESLGGTGFYVPRRSDADTARMIHDSGRLPAAEFGARYRVAPGYQVASNDWFEKTAAIPARFNRLVLYDGGAVFHGSDITAPERLSGDPARGRLTWNGFFVCRRTLA